MEPQFTDQTPVRGSWRNWDMTSVAAFATAAVLGTFGTINTIRHEFYQSFISGWNRVPTAFTDITETFRKRQNNNLLDFQRGAIDGTTYRGRIIEIAKDNQTAVSTRLLEKFNIPTHGWAGWTEGTIKRYKQIGSTSRLNAGLGFATTAAITVGAISMLRHSKNTLDRVEDKIDTASEQRGR